MKLALWQESAKNIINLRETGPSIIFSTDRLVRLLKANYQAQMNRTLEAIKETENNIKKRTCE